MGGAPLGELVERSIFNGPWPLRSAAILVSWLLTFEFGFGDLMEC